MFARFLLYYFKIFRIEKFLYATEISGISNQVGGIDDCSKGSWKHIYPTYQVMSLGTLISSLQGNWDGEMLEGSMYCVLHTSKLVPIPFLGKTHRS